MKSSETLFLTVTLLSIVCLSGCGDKTDETAQNKSSVTRPASATSRSTPVVTTTTTDTEATTATAMAFMQALRDGDKEATSALLSSKAIKQLAEHNLFPEPPGNTTATFHVEKVDFLEGSKNGAYVQSVWMDADSADRTDGNQLTWVLRREKSGWRVAGLATRPFPDSEPVFLNFEDPTDMGQKLDDFEAELTRRNETAATLQAQAPGDGGNPLR